ncbi:MAG: HIT domain-containing protein [Chloroflexi bacterium]|nr:HIT domain-containing protein [Chloroflexota bacterium]
MKHLWTPWRMPYLRGAEEHDNDGCVFCIGAVEDDASVHILFRAKHCYVILNRFPYNTGHLMVIPYAHHSSLEQLDSATLDEMMTLAQLSVRVLRQAYDPQGFNLGMNIGDAAGAGVAEHLHLHVVPRWAGDTNALTVVSQTRIIPEWLDQMYDRLRPLFDQIRAE